EYIFAGPRMRDILEGYTFVTGRMELPPLWGAGPPPVPLVSLHAGARRGHGRSLPRARRHPDVLWLDIDYMDEYRVFTWNTGRFPDPAQMLGDLRGRGAPVSTSPSCTWRFDTSTLRTSTSTSSPSAKVRPVVLPTRREPKGSIS
ncbi:MAG: hypothetical protein HC923_13075, partial [Myxococcales bacterium]|nr:hypothetical protein [Myxococcales bacterium]